MIFYSNIFTFDVLKRFLFNTLKPKAVMNHQKMVTAKFRARLALQAGQNVVSLSQHKAHLGPCPTGGLQ